MKVRIAKCEDAEIISNVLASSWKSAYRGIVNYNYLNSLKNNHWTDYLITGITNGSIFVLVLEEVKKIIGAAIISKDEKTNSANLISFYLLPNKIGQGFGHAFYVGIETELKSKGFSKCILDVLENNIRAISFYKAHGFKDTSDILKTSLGGCEYTCKIFEKQF